MTGNRHVIAFVLLILALSACASTPPEASGPPRTPGAGRVEVTMTGFKNDDGQALVAFFLDDSSWPDPDESIFAAVTVPIRNGRAVAEFEAVPAGPFAVSVFHDANGNRVLDTNVLGIPSEDYGFSADARGTFGPPKFKEARLDLAPGEVKQITVHVK